MDEQEPTTGAAVPLIRLAAEADLPSRFGAFRVHAFDVTFDGHEYGAVVKGDVRGQRGVPVRLHVISPGRKQARRMLPCTRSPTLSMLLLKT